MGAWVRGWCGSNFGVDGMGGVGQNSDVVGVGQSFGVGGVGPQSFWRGWRGLKSWRGSITTTKTYSSFNI